MPRFESQINIVVPSGTAPLLVNQSTLVANLNADLLDGQHGAYFENRDTTAVGFSGGTLTLTRASGNLTASLDGRYLPLTGGVLTGALTGTTAAFGGDVALNARVSFGNRQPVYSLLHGGAQDLAWKKIADITLNTSLYSGATFKVDVIDANTNFGANADCKPMTFFVSCRRSGGVLNDTDSALVFGPVADYVRAVKTATGAYELQIRQIADWLVHTFISEVISQGSGTTVTYVTGTPANGSTTGTIYLPTTGGYTQRFTNLAVTGATTFGGIATFSGASGTYINTGGGNDAFGYNATAGLGHYIKGTGNTYIYGGGAFFDGSTTRTLLHAGNYNSYALPLTGGTITGQLSVNGSTASDILRLYTTGSTIWKLGVTDASGSLFNITADFGNFTISKFNGNVATPGSFVSTVATGTAPLSVTSTTVVGNLNSDLLDGQHGSYFENRDTTAVGFSGGTLTLTRAAGNLTTSLDGRYLPLAGGAMTGSSTISGDNHMTFGPNSSWGSSIRIGGNGYTATGTEMASVVTTDGNLHLDAAKSVNGIYLNWYGGTTGVFFGNGSSGQVGRVDGSGNASFSGTLSATGAITQNGNQVLHAGNYGGYSTFSGAVTSGYGTFASPGHIIGDAQYGFYASAGSLFYKSASTGNHVWRNIANSADTMTLDNSGNLLLSGSLRLTDTTTGISKSGGRLSIRSESTDDVANFASYGLYLPKSGQTAGLYVESAIEARAGIRFGTSAANGTITVGADTGITANRLVQRDGSGNIAVAGIKQGPDLARPLASWGVSGISTGMVIFSFPGGSGNYGMVHCVFDIYEYNSNTVSTVIVGGHNWNGQWYNTGSNVIGRCGKTVRLGFKDGKYCVVFGGAASSWEYGTIVLRKIHNGAFYTGIMDMGGAFTTSQTATESFTWVTGDLRVLRSSAAIISDDYLRGTEVYSSNWFRNDNSGSGIYNSATSNHFYSDGPYWNVAYSGTQGIRFRNGHNGTILGYIYAETDGNFGLLSNNGGWAVQVKPGGGGNLNGTWTINTNTPLTSANYSSYALPLTGGTLTGALTINATGSVLGTAYNHSTYFGGTTAGSIRGSNEGYIVISSNSAGTSDKSIYLNSAASIHFDALSHYRFNKPSTAGYQTVALFGTAGAGLFLTTDSPIISTGAYYNNGWIATAASGTLTDYVNGAYEWSTFSGATVGSAPTLVARMTLSNAGTLNVVGAITQGGNQVLHAGNFNSYAMLTTGIPSGSDQYVNFRVIRNSAAGSTDGMYIGYGNAGSGRTRIYSEGSTTSHVYPDSSGNLFRSDGAAYLHSSNYTSYTAPNAANLPYSWSNTANVAVFSGSYGYNANAAKYLLLWQRTSGATGTNGRFVDGMLKVWRGANHAGNGGTVGYVHASSGYSGQSSEVLNYTPFSGQGLTFSSVVYNSVEWIAVAMPVSDYFWEFRGNYGIQGDTTTVPILVQAGQAGVGAVTNLATGSPIITSSTYSLFSSFTGTVSGSNFSGPGTGLTGLAAGLSIGGNAATATRLTNLTSTTTSTAGTDNSESCISYINGISLFGQTDGALYSHVYSASWKHNIYGDYRTGQLAVRGKNNGTWQAWRVVLDASNYTGYAIARGGDTVDGVTLFRSNKGATSTVGANNTYQLQVYTSDGGAAGMSFHRGGYYAVNMGLDPDNVLRIGGWSASANRWQLDMSGNQTLAGNLTAVNGIFSGNIGAGTSSPYGRLDLGADTGRKLFIYGQGGNVGYITGLGVDLSGSSALSFFTGIGRFEWVKGTGNYPYSAYTVQMTLDASSNLNVAGAITQAGNQVLHAGNVSTYTIPYLSAVAEASLDTATGTGLRLVNKTGYSSTLLTLNVSGSTGPFQLDANYTGVLRWRNQTDSTTWTAWKTLIHDGNYTSYPPARWATGRTISLTGDVTGTSVAFDGTAALSFAATIANSSVTYAKIQNVAVSSVLGNSSASVAQAPQALSMATLAGMLSGQTMNIVGSSTSCTGNAATATLATKASTLSQGGGNGSAMTFNWAGQSGQPSWLWGSNDGVNIYVWNPSNFSVASAASCSGSAAQLNGQAASYYENRDTTSVSISAGTLTLGRGAGNLTTTIGGRVVAWCDFNGNFASSQSPNASFNVSSITKNATGDYTVNFSSSLGTANYVVAGTAQLDTPSPGASNYNVMVAVPRRSGAKAAGSCRVVCEYPAGVALYDSISVGVAFIAA